MRIEAGELVLSRDELDPNGPVTAKVIEEVFVRQGEILNLHVGGRVIETTPEHPFYVQDKGWIPAGELQIGDLLSTEAGDWIAVEDLLDTGKIQSVYNFRVADYHTYFVGSTHWGFSVWVHNQYHPNASAEVRHLGEQFRGRAEELWNTLPRPNRYGATVAVSQVDGVEVVALYANVGRGQKQFLQAQINRFLRSVEENGGVAIHTYGKVHAERALHEAFGSAPAIGISNPYGPCAALCGEYFTKVRYYNLYWPGNRPSQW